MSEEAKLALEPYATLRAEIDAGEPLDSIIDREGISPEAWAASQAFWLKQMADEAENERFETTTRYNTLYRTKKKLFDAENKRRNRPPVEIQEPPVGPLLAAEKELSARPAVAILPMPLVEPPFVARPIAAPSFVEASGPSTQGPQPPSRISTPMPFAAVSPPPAYSPGAVAPPGIVAAPPRAPPMHSPPVQTAPFQAPPAQAPPIQAPPSQSQPRPDSPLSRLAAAMGQRPPEARPPVTQPTPPQRESVGRTMAVDIEQLMASVVPFDLPDETQATDPSGQVQPVHPPAAHVQPPQMQPAHVQARQVQQAAPPHPVQQAKKQNLMSTMAFDVDQLMAKATPFAGGAAASPKREDERPNLASGTPFQQGPSGPQHPAAQRPNHTPQPFVSPVRPAHTPQPFVSPARPQNPLSQTMVPDDEDDPRTMMLADGADPLAGSRARPLPFGTTADVSKIQGHDAPSSTRKDALPFSAPHANAPPAIASKAIAPTAIASTAMAQPAPSAPSVQAPANAKIFSINQFASLTAEIAEHPEKIEEVRRKYGVTETQHHAESQRWTEEFAVSSELRQRYFGIVSRYREYLRKKP